VKYLEEHSAIPTTVVSLSAPAIRGELAEALFRIKTERTDKPSSTLALLERNTAMAERAAPGGPSGKYLLFETFDDANMNGWSVVDKGGIDTPSMWTVRNVSETPDGVLRSFATPRLVQFENTYNNNASLVTGREGTYAYWNAPSAFSWKDYSFAITLYSPDDDGTGVFFRYRDAANYLKLDLDRQRNFAKLLQVKNGKETVLAETAVAYPISTDFRIVVSAAGNEITASMGGNDLFGTVTDPSPTTGTIALYCWGNMGVAFDDITVTHQ